MEMDVHTPPKNDRAVIGNNKPPVDPREELSTRAKELRAAGSAWVNEIQKIETQEQADAAAAYKRQCSDLVKRAEIARKAEKEPHLEAAKDVDKFWKGVTGSVELAADIVSTKLGAFLKAEQERQEREAEEARKVAAEAERKAQEEAERAFEIYDKAERGELAGTGVNTMAAIEEADKAQEAAEKAKEEAERLANRKAGAGGQYTVGGTRRTVVLKTNRAVVLDLPEKVPEKVMIEALKKLVPYIVKGGELNDLRTEMGRLANRIFKKTDEVPPGCKVVETSKAV